MNGPQSTCRTGLGHVEVVEAVLLNELSRCRHRATAAPSGGVSAATLAPPGLAPASTTASTTSSTLPRQREAPAGAAASPSPSPPPGTTLTERTRSLAESRSPHQVCVQASVPAPRTGARKPRPTDLVKSRGWEYGSGSNWGSLWLENHIARARNSCRAAAGGEADAGAAPTLPVTSPAVVGREHELAVVRAFLERGPGRPGARGGGGIGKTTVWEAGLEAARERRVAVLVARPAETETALPYAALADLLEPVLDVASRAMPARSGGRSTSRWCGRRVGAPRTGGRSRQQR